MYEALLKATPEYQKIAASLASPGPAALFGRRRAGRCCMRPYPRTWAVCCAS